MFLSFFFNCSTTCSRGFFLFRYKRMLFFLKQLLLTLLSKMQKYASAPNCSIVQRSSLRGANFLNLMKFDSYAPYF